MDTPGDPFDDILNLEDQYHSEGFNLGVADGSRAGHIEGRIFGLEKGFDKFLDMGRLAGRAAIWDTSFSTADDIDRDVAPRSTKVAVNKGERLMKHISRLKDLTDPETLSTENNEDAVSDFDDRQKDAKAKAALISRLAGEDDAKASTEAGQPQRSPHQGLRLSRAAGGKPTKEIEDFAGLPRGKSSIS